MAALPPRYTAAGGRSRSSDAPSTSGNDELFSSGANNDRNQTSSETFEDSETVFLNRPSSPAARDSDSREPTPADVSEATVVSPEASPTVVDAADEEPRKCWICYMDETEDTPFSSEWRSPCPCALTAHESCLLDWLADLENPKSRKRNGGAAKMLCPQCKSEIVISRPRSYIVDLVRSMERIAGRLVLPGMVFTLAGTVWAGCCAHGVYSLYLVFGPEDARRIFEDSVDGAWSPALNLGLPLIPLALIFSRTRYAEGLLPAIPVLFFATHSPGGHEADIDLWPPSAAMTFAALPYVKSFYNALYDRLFGKLERKWIAEVQPRAGEAEDPDIQQDPANAALPPLGDIGDGQILMEIDLELQVGMGDDNDQPQAMLGLGAGNNQQGAAGGQAAQGGQNGQGGPLLGRRHDDLIHDTSNVADTILGALLFPAISAGMGGILKYILPRSWTTPSSVLDRAKPGLLQSRWGRSVVGGCLFVLLKDALILYCRWKLAQTHRKRRVLNYDRTKKQVVGR
ncbi:hypothetical protein DTO169E5_8235 [Paecilomyces variotii]|nr:hypothetical protein DTO169E5_8235 [Paecilomyces variotii]KAJ9287098.1 hypothetical protein DTO021C3_5234 [Paecilomyces variotii]